MSRHMGAWSVALSSRPEFDGLWAHRGVVSRVKGRCLKDSSLSRARFYFGWRKAASRFLAEMGLLARGERQWEREPLDRGIRTPDADGIAPRPKNRMK